MGASGAILGLYLKVLKQGNFVVQFYQRMLVLFVKQQNSVSELAFGGLTGENTSKSAIVERGGSIWGYFLLG